MPSRAASALICAVLRPNLQAAITGGTANVSELEILARASGLLGERQRISQAKQFKRAKITLGIQSVRQGFGPGGGWAWVLPPPANAPASETKPKEQVIRAEPKREGIYCEGVVGAAPRASVIDDVEMPPGRRREGDKMFLFGLHALGRDEPIA